jgi:hypothetical protein
MPLLKPPEPVITSSVFFRFQVKEIGPAKNPSRGRTRWRGSRRSPLTEPSQFQPNPQLCQRKKKNRNISSLPQPQ